MTRIHGFILAIALASGSASMATEPAIRSSPFGVMPVADRALSASYGMALPSYDKVGASVDFASRTDFRLTGSISRIEMDVWWGTVGSELIANAVRTQP